MTTPKKAAKREPRSTFDPRTPAREKTPFGNFQLKPSHLKTGAIVNYTPSPSPPDVRRSAALTVADCVPIGDVREVLDILGLITTEEETS